MKVLIDRLPGFWAGAPQVVELQRVLDKMVQAAGSSQADTLAQLFLPTATWGLSWWEQAYGITPASGQTEEQRRTRILGKIRGQGVATVALIQATAGAYVDAAVSVDEHPNEFRFTVVFDGIGAQPPEPEEIAGVPRAVVDLIADSLESIADEDGYAFMGELGNLLIRQQPDFDPRNYGFSKLTQLIRSIDRFEVDVRQTGNPHTKHIYVRDKRRK